MNEQAIAAVIESSERALATGGRADLRALGFWRAVGALKRRPDLVERYGARVARIDRDAFLRAVPLAFPAPIGVALELAGTAAGVALVVVAPILTPPLRELAILAGAGALIGATHGLTHYVVGRAIGIRFTHFFSKPPFRPQPGFKTDYESYLRAPARARAWMHASGALVSKVVPFALVPAALVTGAEAWCVGALLAIGMISIVTDVLFSVRASDWKRFRREMRVARAATTTEPQAK